MPEISESPWPTGFDDLRNSYLGRFTGRAEAYSKYRPRYPPKVLEILRSEFGYDNRKAVADIGSGTGILAELFLRHGARLVYGVEPNDDMRQKGEEILCKKYPESFWSVKGTAESTTLPPGSVDLIVVGQALHWFDLDKCKKEFRRILRPRGRVCVLYNDRAADGGTTSEYNGIVRAYERRDGVPHVDDPVLSEFYQSSRKFTMRNSQRLTFEGLVGRALSAGYSPGPEANSGRAALTDALRTLYRRRAAKGRVTLRYITRMYVGGI